MVLVLELGHIVAGPTAGLILSDLGYDVVKIEKPGEGDIARRLTSQSAGAFPFYNRNKKSMTLDLKQDEGREIFKQLAKKADVIIDNMGYGAMDRLGLSYETLSGINPGIIYLSLKGYAKGPYENRKSLDYPIEVHSGLAYMTGLSGRPMRVGGSMVDMSAAMFGIIGILDAMMQREKTGKGRFIDIGLFETAAFFMGQHIATYQITGIPMKPINEEGFAWAIYDFFETKDDLKIFVAVTTDPQWRKFCDGLSLGVCQEESMSRNEKRFERRNFLIPLIASKIKEIESEQLIKMLSELNVSYAVLNQPWDLLQDPHEKEKLIKEHYENRDISIPGTPVNQVYARDPPKLGENSEEMLKLLGYSEGEIAALREKSVI